MRRERNLIEPGPDAPFSEVSTNLGWLLGGSVLAAFLINAGPIAVTLLATPDGEVARRQVHDEHGHRSRAAVPLPSGAGVTATEARVCSSAPVASTTSAPASAGCSRRSPGSASSAIVGAFLFGPLVVRILFGPDYDLGRRNLTMLAASSALYMLAITTSQAIIALHGHARVAIGWLVGVITFLVVTALGNDLLLRVETGLVAGSAMSVLALWLLLRPLLKRGGAPDEESLTEAFQDLPLEP